MKIDLRIKEDLKKFLTEERTRSKSTVQIRSAHPLDQLDINLLYKAIPRLKGIAYRVIIDPSLIAGLIVQQGSQIIDLSLSGQLKNLRASIYEIDR